MRTEMHRLESANACNCLNLVLTVSAMVVEEPQFKAGSVEIPELSIQYCDLSLEAKVQVELDGGAS